jgi:thiamine pyrophosphokinase
MKNRFLPHLIKGDLDSIRPDVQSYYASETVNIVKDPDQNSTDLMKCVNSISDLERILGVRYDIVILGGLSGRLDQTVHTLSYLHKLRKSRPRTYAVTDDNVGWVLDRVSFY